MKVELERSGGFAGRTMRWTLDTEALPHDEAAAIARLAAQAPGWAGAPAPGNDRFAYRLRIVDGATPVDVTFGEPEPAAARPLLERLRRENPQPG
ncbi:MAG: protealysin inhibitor emfourin [Pseudonocardiales bacterium]